MDKVQKIRKEVQRLMNELIQEKEKGYGSDTDDACILELQNVLTYIDSLQEELVSIWHDSNKEQPNFASTVVIWSPKHKNGEIISRCTEVYSDRIWAYIDDLFTKWPKANLWKPADGDDLPDIDREVIVLYQPYPCEGNEYAVSFAHRPNPDGWDGKNLLTDEIEHYTLETYDKGGWNIPDVKFWLDLELPIYRKGE